MKPLFLPPPKNLLMKAASSRFKMRKRLEYTTLILCHKELFTSNILMT